MRTRKSKTRHKQGTSSETKSRKTLRSSSSSSSSSDAINRPGSGRRPSVTQIQIQGTVPSSSSISDAISRPASGRRPSSKEIERRPSNSGRLQASSDAYHGNDACSSVKLRIPEDKFDEHMIVAFGTNTEVTPEVTSKIKLAFGLVSMIIQDIWTFYKEPLWRKLGIGMKLPIRSTPNYNSINQLLPCVLNADNSTYNHLINSDTVLLIIINFLYHLSGYYDNIHTVPAKYGKEMSDRKEMSDGKDVDYIIASLCFPGLEELKPCGKAALDIIRMIADIFQHFHLNPSFDEIRKLTSPDVSDTHPAYDLYVETSGMFAG
jgi:hypothetical protein